MCDREWLSVCACHKHPNYTPHPIDTHHYRGNSMLTHFHTNCTPSPKHFFKLLLKKVAIHRSILFICFGYFFTFLCWTTHAHNQPPVRLATHSSLSSWSTSTSVNCFDWSYECLASVDVKVIFDYFRILMNSLRSLKRPTEAENQIRNDVFGNVMGEDIEWYELEANAKRSKSAVAYYGQSTNQQVVCSASSRSMRSLTNWRGMCEHARVCVVCCEFSSPISLFVFCLKNKTANA